MGYVIRQHCCFGRVDDDCVLLTSAYSQNKIAKLRVTLNGAEMLWEQKAASKVCTPLISDGRVYWAWHSLFCLDFVTGEIMWRGGTHGDPGSCIASADGRLIVWSGTGDLTLVEMAKRSPREYMELASKKAICNADAWPHVVLSDGRLYCKDRTGHVVCLEVSP